MNKWPLWDSDMESVDDALVAVEGMVKSFGGMAWAIDHAWVACVQLSKAVENFMEIENGVQPNCSEFVYRLADGSPISIKQAVRYLAMLADYPGFRGVRIRALDYSGPAVEELKSLGVPMKPFPLPSNPKYDLEFYGVLPHDCLDKDNIVKKVLWFLLNNPVGTMRLRLRAGIYNGSNKWMNQCDFDVTRCALDITELEFGFHTDFSMISPAYSESDGPLLPGHVGHLDEGVFQGMVEHVIGRELAFHEYR